MKKTVKPTAGRQRHSEDFKREALKLADKVGVAAAARQLSLHDSQLYAWRNKLRQLESQSDAERRLLEENAKLKRQLAEQAEELAIIKKAAAYFAKHTK